ncbi:MAG: phosphatidate cytidylyltransferase [Rhodoblastus sp.]
MTPPQAQSGSGRKGRNFSDLRLRVLSALVMAALAVGALVAGGMPFVLFWLAAAIAMVWEWQRLVGEERQLSRVVAGAASVAVACAFATQNGPDIAIFVLALGALGAGALAPAGLRLWAGAGVFYAGALILAIAAIRPPLPALIEPPYNLRAILWLFAVVWGTDVMAYFGGRLIGGPKLWKRVSAGKTWSGAIVGIICGALLGLAVTAIAPAGPVAVWPVFFAGLAAAAAAQAGDLLESAVKRRFDVKDSSQLIPGHGGVMDRLDGFIAAAVFVALLGVARGAPSAAEGLFVWS